MIKKLPQIPSPPADARDEKKRAFSRFSILKRRIRVRGNSSISVPLGFVLLFPSVVVIAILILFLSHPKSPARILIPAGTPPSIR